MKCSGALRNHGSGIDFHLRSAAPAHAHPAYSLQSNGRRNGGTSTSMYPCTRIHHALTPKLRIRVVGSDIRPNINLLNLRVVCELQPPGDLVGGDTLTAPGADSEAVTGQVTAYRPQVAV